MTDRLTQPASPLVSPSEAASILQVSPRTLWRWQAKGHITPHRLPNGYRRFRLEDLERIMGERVA